ncbi:hypothetical protein CRG98_027357 [Punica granatum]|uniref:RNase H type-1 domain-containing protein n=1 Tax=Punica granatum TaxID=22663 RepID=A0A2I0J7P9_PUNGR|nr:hypothetical protein CRG98_027357 [Punica granatum]
MSRPIYFGKGLDENGHIPKIKESLHRFKGHKPTPIELTKEINLRQQRADLLLRIKEEVLKRINAGFLKICNYSEWVANIVLVEKKDLRVRFCIEYRDLNKASPKNNFPLLYIHVFVENTSRHIQVSFKDDFFEYNQIWMDREHKTKTTFVTMWGPFCYRVIPFGLKNVKGILQVDDEEDKLACKMYFDDTVNFTGSEMDEVLLSLEGRYYLVAVKIDFPCTNNVAEYEACILGLQAAINFKIRELEVFGDSMLTIFQMLRQWKTNDAKLVPYHEYLDELAENFKRFLFTYTSRIKN